VTGEELHRRINREFWAREFWAFLRAKGFPKISDEIIMAEASRVEAEASHGKCMKVRRWRYTDGGQHSDDVALVRILAESLGLVLNGTGLSSLTVIIFSSHLLDTRKCENS